MSGTPTPTDAADAASDPLGLRPCPTCGGPTTIALTVRAGPSPGNMIVCQNPDCDGSAEGMARQQTAMMRRWLRDSARTGIFRRQRRFLSGIADSYDHYRRRVGCGPREALTRAYNYERGLGVDGERNPPHTPVP